MSRQMRSVDMSPAAISQRLRQVARHSDLRSAHRLSAKSDMSPEAVTRRLRTVSKMRRICLALGSPPTPDPPAPGA